MGFGAGCLVFHDRHVLLNLRGEGEAEPLTWCPFGGGGERGETPVECMLREMREEAGVALDLARCAYLHTRRRDAYAFHTFAAFPIRAPRVVLSAESRDARWFPLGDGPATLWAHLPRPLHSGMREIAADRGLARLVHALASTGPRRPSRPMPEPAACPSP
jgi:8-oxo-dGTP diphosphatase